jgi:hypothetical protein
MHRRGSEGPTAQSPHPEKTLQDLTRRQRIAGPSDQGAMVTGGLLEKSGAVQDGTTLGIFRRENQPGDPGQGDRAGTHGAWFQRDEQAGSPQPFIAQSLRARPQHQHLGMGGGIAALQDPVAVLGQERAIGGQQHGPDRHLAPCPARLRFGKRQCYGFIVLHGDPFVGR